MACADQALRGGSQFAQRATLPTHPSGGVDFKGTRLAHKDRMKHTARHAKRSNPLRKGAKRRVARNSLRHSFLLGGLQADLTMYVVFVSTYPFRRASGALEAE